MKIVKLIMRLNIYKSIAMIETYDTLYSDTYLLTSKERDTIIRALRVLHEAALAIEEGDDFGSEITHGDVVEAWEHGAKLLENQYDAILKSHFGE